MFVIFLPMAIIGLCIFWFCEKREQQLELKVNKETKNWADAKAFSKN